MCAAPHGTTMGYTIKEDGMAVPVCKPMGAVDQANAALAEQQERICLAFTERVLPQVSGQPHIVFRIKREFIPLVMALY